MIYALSDINLKNPFHNNIRYYSENNLINKIIFIQLGKCQRVTYPQISSPKRNIFILQIFYRIKIFNKYNNQIFYTQLCRKHPVCFMVVL